MTWPACWHRSNASCLKSLRISVVIGMLALAGCGAAPTPGDGHDHGQAWGQPVLRAVYRDATHRLLVVLPDRAHQVPRGDCAAPVLIDEPSGAARQVTPAVAAQWMRHMQLSGAVQGICP